MVSYDSVTLLVKVYGEFFGEPNGSLYEVSKGIYKPARAKPPKTHVLCTWVL